MFQFFLIKQQYLFIYWYGHTLPEKRRRPRKSFIATTGHTLNDY